VDSPQDVVEEDRMRFARIRTPENDDAGAFSFFVGAGAAARAEDRRQTDNARSVSRSVAAVDVVAADGDASELLSHVVHFVGRLRAAKHSVRSGSIAFPGAA
jgi:hypothetical protein